MPAPANIDRLIQQIRSASDERLLEIVGEESHQYTLEAVSIAEEEIASRGGIAGLRTPERRDLGNAAPALDVSGVWRRARSLLVGRNPVKKRKYLPLFYVAAILRLVAVGFAGFSGIALISGMNELIPGGGEFLSRFLVSAYAFLVAAMTFGASEALKILIEIAQNTARRPGD